MKFFEQFKSPDDAREALKDAIEYLVDVDGYTDNDVLDLVQGQLADFEKENLP